MDATQTDLPEKEPPCTVVFLGLNKTLTPSQMLRWGTAQVYNLQVWNKAIDYNFGSESTQDFLPSLSETCFYYG